MKVKRAIALIERDGWYLDSEASRVEAMNYLIVIEKTGTGYSAYSPDLPGCVSTGGTRAEMERNMQEAMEFHVDGLREEGYAVPEPMAASAYVRVARAA